MLRLPTKKMKKLVCVSGCNRILHELYSFSMSRNAPPWGGGIA